MFTTEDKAFIRAILSNPAELTGWLIYADWLDEHDNPAQAEFLRLMARRGQLRDTDPEWPAVEERLAELRAALEPVWVEIFDRPKIENCAAAFRFKCPKQWENLKVTGDPTARHCDACHKLVYYCHTLPDAQDLARLGYCVALQLGVRRYPDDLVPRERDELNDMVGMLMIDPEPPRRRPWWKFW